MIYKIKDYVFTDEMLLECVHGKISPCALFVLAYFCKEKNYDKNRHIYDWDYKIAKKLGLEEEKVGRAIEELIEKGYLEDYSTWLDPNYLHIIPNYRLSQKTLNLYNEYLQETSIG